MRKLVLTILALVVIGSVYAQKGSVSKATGYLGKGDYANAKAEIDVAITIEKNAAKAKTWFERAKIYQAIATNEDATVRDIDTDATTKAAEAFAKVEELEKEGSATVMVANANKETMWGYFLNLGGDNYGKQAYDVAYKNFTDALIVKPGDSTTTFYAGISAQQGELFDEALMHFYSLDKRDLAGEDVYSSMIYIERAVKKDEEKALAAVRRAKEKFPDNKTYSQEEVSILINLKKLDEAKDQAIASIEKDPGNVNLRLNLAIMYDHIGSETTGDEAKENYGKALEQYLEVIEIEPENYVANYNAGAIYINNAKEYYDEVRDMDLATYNKKGEALTKKGDEILVNGLPYMEKAVQIKEDVDGVTALMQMYKQLKNFDKAEQLLGKLDELEAAAGGE